MERLVQALLDGDQAQAITATLQLRAAGVDQARIVAEGIEAAMAHLDAKCTLQQFNLLEIMLCGRAVTGVMKELFPADAPAPVESTRGTLVIASLEGDVHDLGKNITKMVLTVAGYRVVDCGKDCPLERLVETAEREAALAVAISGLISTVVPQVRRVREALAARGLSQVKVMAGGAALKQSGAAGLNVDFVAQNAFDGLHYLNGLTGADDEQP
jgi:methanogenic corrinoid protein MtbC1